MGNQTGGKAWEQIQEVADELGYDWHRINDAVVAYGEVLVNDPSRVSDIISLCLDENLFLREGNYRRQTWATSIVDSKDGYLFDVVPSRSGTEPIAWIEQGQGAGGRTFNAPPWISLAPTPRHLISLYHMLGKW